MKKLLVIIFSALLLCSCGLKKVVKTYGNYPSTNSVEVIDNGKQIPDGLEKIGMVNVFGKAFTTTCNCTYIACMEEIKNKAMKIGGDYVYIVDISSPNGWTTCYGIAADVYRKKQH